MILSTLGIYGWDSLELPIIAALITGDPVILVGSRGTNKTKATKLISQLVTTSSEKYYAYSTPNNEFEDMVGIPSPKAMMEGNLDFIKSPISVWDKEFILLGEINRCKANLQSKYLQLILEREVLGLKTNVKWVWSDMNPLHYSGTQPLDLAVADRYSTVLFPPEFMDMSEDDREAVGAVNGGSTYFPILDWDSSVYDDVRNTSDSSSNIEKAKEMFSDLRQKIVGTKDAPGYLMQVKQLYGKETAKYFSQVTALMKKDIEDNKKNMSLNEYNMKRENLFSGRRANMLVRTFEATVAVKWAMSDQRPSPAQIDELMRGVVERGNVSILAGNDLFDRTSFSKAHAIAIKSIQFAGNYWQYRGEIESNPVKKAFIQMNFDDLSVVNNALVEFLSHTIVIKDTKEAEPVPEKRFNLSEYSTELQDFFARDWATLFTVPAAMSLACAPLIMSPDLNISLKAVIEKGWDKVNYHLSLYQVSKSCISPDQEFSDLITSTIQSHTTKYKDSKDPLDWLPLELFQSIVVNIVAESFAKEDFKTKDYQPYIAELKYIYNKSVAIVEEVKKYMYPTVNKILDKSYEGIPKTYVSDVKSLFDNLEKE